MESETKCSVSRSPKTKAPPGTQIASAASGSPEGTLMAQGVGAAALQVPTSDRPAEDSADGTIRSSSTSSTRPESTHDRPAETSDTTPRQSPRSVIET